MKPEHERAIGAAADRYVAATEEQKAASAHLAEVMNAAFKDGEQQSSIIRAARHVWSREYVRVVLGLTKRTKGDES